MMDSAEPPRDSHAGNEEVDMDCTTKIKGSKMNESEGKPNEVSILEVNPPLKEIIQIAAFKDMTRDYDLLVDEELVLNCTLNSNIVQINDKSYNVDSSHLLFRKGSSINSDYVTILSNVTAQLRIPHANRNDSGFYFCELAVPNLGGEHLVCNSKVSVGYPPQPVKNFHCVSKHYENLTCTWEIEESGVQTKYTLFKHHFFSTYFENPALQQCPKDTMNNTYCQWREDTDPPFEAKERNFTFVLQGNNSLGFSSQKFVVDHYEIFVPSSPQSLVVEAVNRRNISIRWSAPEKMKYTGQPPLKYEMWLEEMIGEQRDRKVFDIGVDVTSYTIFGLVPFMTYNISLRCRSKFANNSGMWSPFISIQNRTLPDVPYEIPEIIPEAFELRHYDGYRTVTLYWKPVSSRHFNGENFQYRVVYSQNNLPIDNTVSTMKSVNTTALSTTFTKLQENISYVFHLYTMNKEGLSSRYKVIVVDSQDKVPEPPEDITAISHDLGHYQLSWKPPRKNAASVKDYVVFWCSSLKPLLSRCEKPIQWLNSPLSANNVTLNLSDSSTTFQFAVVARTNTASSGMQWATCIVPLKAALSKIVNVIVEPKNSGSLKVMWRLDCPAQKAVVKKFEIDYCKINEAKQCQDPKQTVTVIDSSLESYLLENLHPFSNYSIILRAYNLAGIASEDSDPKFQATMPGAPSDPPQHVRVVPIANAGLQLRWQKPLQPNGVITHYRLRYNNNILIIPVNEDKITYEHFLDGLLHYTKYNISIGACVSHLCSPMSEIISVRTEIGVPGVMDSPRVEIVNSTAVKVSWKRPPSPNGPIDFYEIQWKEVNSWNTTDGKDIQHKRVKDGLSVLIEMKCTNVKDGGIKYLFVVRAINIKNKEKLYGPLSDESQVRACLLTQGVAMIVGIAIGGTLALAVIMLLICKLIKWMSDKIHQVKNITVRLPKGLDGPETNPLNNYENFKNGLLPQALNNNNNVGRLSYIADDYDKNRHGSGSSQYSFSSTDELLYKNGKCTKFARKPSGESSGCSSMSSNVTKLQSSDSSTESDFMTPPSPDMVFQERNIQNGLKGILPIVMEAQDSLNSNGTALNSAQQEPAKLEEKNSIADGVVLKIDQPYSKFGVSSKDGSVPLWWMNPLTFYNNSLSNSEPSVTDIKEPLSVFMPYSKIGLAKSSGDILGLTQVSSDLGYSKFGIMPTSKIVSPECSLHKRVLMNKLKENDYSIKDFMNKHQYLNDEIKGKNGVVGNNVLQVSPFTTDMKIPLEKQISEINGDNGYIKFRRGNPSIQPLKSGYVPFNELSHMSDFLPATLPVYVDDDLQKMSLETVEEPSADYNIPPDILPNPFQPDDSLLILVDPGSTLPPVEIKLNDKQGSDVQRNLTKSDGDYPMNEVCVTSSAESVEEGMGNPVLDYRRASLSSEVEVQSQEPCPKSQGVIDTRTNAVVKNGYIPFTALSNLCNERNPQPLTGVVSVKEDSVDTECHSSMPDVKNCAFQAAKPSSDHQHLYNQLAIGHLVHPVANNIPIYDFGSSFNSDCHPHISPQPLLIDTHKGFTPQRLLKLGPMVESEICEV